MVIICPALRISGCAQGSSELSYRQGAARDYRVPEGIDRHSVNNDSDSSTMYSTADEDELEDGFGIQTL